MALRAVACHALEALRKACTHRRPPFARVPLCCGSRSSQTSTLLCAPKVPRAAIDCLQRCGRPAGWPCSSTRACWPVCRPVQPAR